MKQSGSIEVIGIELISKKEPRLRLPPKKTIPVWRIVDPYFLVKKVLGTSL